MAAIRWLATRMSIRGVSVDDTDTSSASEKGEPSLELQLSLSSDVKDGVGSRWDGDGRDL